jgi:hypothetical protein
MLANLRAEMLKGLANSGKVSSMISDAKGTLKIYELNYKTFSQNKGNYTEQEQIAIGQIYKWTKQWQLEVDEIRKEYLQQIQAAKQMQQQ